MDAAELLRHLEMMAGSIMTHLCPGGCGKQVPSHLYACRYDWFRLPINIRNAIWHAYTNHGQLSSQHVEAMNNARTWYEENQCT